MRDNVKDTTSSEMVSFTVRVFIVVAIGALVGAIWALSDILLLLFGAILFAIILRTLAAPLTRHTGLNDYGALAIAVLGIIIVLAAAVLALGPELVRQMRGLIDTLPQAYEKMAAYLQLGSLSDLIKNGTATSALGSLMSRVMTWSTTAIGAVASLLLVVFGGIYFAASPRDYRQGFMKLVPLPARPHVEATADDAGEALKRWLAAQCIAMALVGLFTALGFWLVGVPSPFALGFIAGLAEFVPIIGPIVAAIPAVLIAGAQDWNTLVLAVAVLVVVQQIESNIIMPVIVGRTVSIAPAAGLFGVVAMGVLFGPLGLLLGFPLAIVFDVAVRRLYVRDLLGERVEIMGKPAKPS